MICEAGDVAVVPFPFTDKPGAKRRPALVLSSRDFNQAGRTICAMITTKSHRPWPGDVEIEDHETAGLPRPCIVRAKLFTLDNRLMLRRAGHLATRDRGVVRAHFSKLVPLLGPS